MSPADIVIVILAVGAVLGATLTAVRRSKRGCGCGCASCPAAASCERKEQITEETDRG